MHVYVHVYVHVHMYVYMYVYEYAHVYVYVYVYMYMYVYVYSRVARETPLHCQRNPPQNPCPLSVFFQNPVNPTGFDTNLRGRLQDPPPSLTCDHSLCLAFLHPPHTN